MERFEREAQSLAALNHPHIVTIFTVEEAEDLHFLTMELVEGKTLTKVIPRGGLPLPRFFQIAIPLTEAVSAAHEKGITHRDLKPGNVMVTEEDRIKVLDFGLAKLRESVRGAVDTQSPTEPATGPGRVLGTAPYMSPEQVQGRALDHRSDVFSLGIILYEMATGERPVRGGHLRRRGLVDPQGHPCFGDGSQGGPPKGSRQAHQALPGEGAQEAVPVHAGPGERAGGAAA